MVPPEIKIEPGQSHGLSSSPDTSTSPTTRKGSTASTAGSASTSPTATTSPLSTKQKQPKRRPHNKSRRGCLTCKRRRVKCDETHPICKNCQHLDLECSFTVPAASAAGASTAPGPNTANALSPGVNTLDIQLFHHYTKVVWKTIVQAGISNEQIWSIDIPQLAFEFPFLMHSVLTFAATHFARFQQDPATCTSMAQVVTFYRADALKLLSEEVRNVTPLNLDALVAASILLILDALANASPDSAASPSSLPASAWLHHVRGAATILTAVGPPTPESRFYSLVNVDLSDLAQGLMTTMPGVNIYSPLECLDPDLQDLYPVSISSPYYHALAYLDKLFRQRDKSDFILRVFSFPALLDRKLVGMLIQGDSNAKKIIRVYYKLVKQFTAEMKGKVWFLEGVANVLPIDMDGEYGGLGFIMQALPLNLPAIEELLQGSSTDPADLLANADIEALAASLNIPLGDGSGAALAGLMDAGGSVPASAVDGVLAQLLTQPGNTMPKPKVEMDASEMDVLIADSPD